MYTYDSNKGGLIQAKIKLNNKLLLNNDPNNLKLNKFNNNK